MGSFSIWHWLIVLVIIVLVFGTKKLPSLGADLGKAIRGFKKGMSDEEREKLEADKLEAAQKDETKSRSE